MKDHIFISRTNIPPELLDSLTISFTNIRESNLSLDNETQSKLDKTIAGVRKMLQAEISGHRSKTISNPAKQAVTFQDYHALIIKIRAKVQEDQV
ncbi:hypothetical protein [Rhizorhabdus sp.]|jgi:hypothetical protein|uniref:hypothetical protein n=1 Tax=Rhizorhabdus sp. TaxID=1968843 RepID=UPI0019AA65F3|nr:hypothetical protein [Rhizorhabdus sp.]MBD3762104.1 hypothetical protein [Rhizorhabdus sp.]